MFLAKVYVNFRLQQSIDSSSTLSKAFLMSAMNFNSVLLFPVLVLYYLQCIVQEKTGYYHLGPVSVIGLSDLHAEYLIVYHFYRSG
jgi:hypothetical protein